MRTTFQKVKDAYESGIVTMGQGGPNDWNSHRIAFTCFEHPSKMAGVLQAFGTYLMCAYDTLFVELEQGGPAVVTAISENGIRVEYIETLDPNGIRDWDWLTVDEMASYGLVVQPPRS